MIRVFQDDGAPEHAALLEKCHRCRHRVSVERLGREALRRPDGREIDRFDGPHAIHVARVDASDAAAFCRRRVRIS